MLRGKAFIYFKPVKSDAQTVANAVLERFSFPPSFLDHGVRLRLSRTCTVQQIRIRPFQIEVHWPKASSGTSAFRTKVLKSSARADHSFSLSLNGIPGA